MAIRRTTRYRKDTYPMVNWIARPMNVLGGIAVSVVIAMVVAQDTLHAQEKDADATVVGTYTRQIISQQVGVQEEIRREIRRLQLEMDAARQDGDQEEMQRIQLTAQRVQYQILNEFDEELYAAMPEVAKATGAIVIAAEIAYVAEGVTLKDVTSDLIAQMTGPDREENLVVPD